ncbi:MAG: preprotein translocase subunit SecG [Flavobacteriales bacterium]|nr:preprotein translocase subunit SecG [Flavobacteriales bacterium]
MASFIILLVVICSVLLGLVVLVQNPKGGGLAVGFQGTQQIGGVQRTTDFLEKATWYLATAVFALCLLSAYFYASERTIQNSPATEQPSGPATGTDAAPPADVPPPQ